MGKTLNEIHVFLLKERMIEFRIRQYQRQIGVDFTATFEKFTRKGFSYAPEHVIADAVEKKDITFLDRIDNACIGIQKLRGNWPYKFLQDIENGDMDAAMIKLENIKGSPLTDQHFFKFKERDYRAFFVTAAHVVSTPQALLTLGHLKADFNAPDSQGRLPLFFISRYATNRWMLPTLSALFNVNANDSGKLPDFAQENMVDQIDDKYDPEIDQPLHPALLKKFKQTQHSGDAVEADLDQPMLPIYDPPLIRALKYRNLHALRGLSMLPPGKIDLNIRFQYNRMTPLIYAVMKADEAVHAYDEWHKEVQAEKDWDKIIPMKIRKWDASKALWAVSFLASLPGVDPDIMDTTRATAQDYAHSKPVNDALLEGLAARQAVIKLFKTHPSTRFTP